MQDKKKDNPNMNQYGSYPPLDDNPDKPQWDTPRGVPSGLEAEIYCDGASSGNPGNSGIGVVIRYPLTVTDMAHHLGYPTVDGYMDTVNKIKISEYIGIATNNIAEYSALIRGLKEARALGFKKIKIFLDSELLVKQIKGLYRVKNNNLKHLWIQTQNILRRFDTYKIIYVRRELNREADALARQAIKNHKK